VTTIEVEEIATSSRNVTPQNDAQPPWLRFRPAREQILTLLLELCQPIKRNYESAKRGAIFPGSMGGVMLERGPHCFGRGRKEAGVVYQSCQKRVDCSQSGTRAPTLAITLFVPTRV
jgi:hypothetical protein